MQMTSQVSRMYGALYDVSCVMNMDLFVDQLHRTMGWGHK